jgi:predicted glycogen debranching enzyme
MQLTLDKKIIQDFNKAIHYEWIETNGLGGWASSTVIGANTRRYHGLLVAAIHPPVGRMVLLSKLDETLVSNGRRYDLGSNQFPGAVHPTGYQYVSNFEKGMFPVIDYSVDMGGDGEQNIVGLRKTIVAINGENTTLILYEVIKADAKFTMELKPLVAARDFHSLAHANDSIQRETKFDDGMFRVQPYESVPELFIKIPGASFKADPDWYLNFEYSVEKARGLDYQEDLFSYGAFSINLKPGDKFGIIISTNNPKKKEAFKLFKEEKNRRKKLFTSLPHRDDITEQLSLAADQFVVRRGENLRSIIAGYHWFADWGRDTMIALPGITLATGRSGVAKKILRAFAASVSQGMLPNRFPDDGEEPEYNTVDATLWFFVAVYKYFQYTKDKKFIRDELLPVFRKIIKWHDRGTRYNICVAKDGLLNSGEPGVQLTWMDAKIGDWVVTPRQGKAVEINALWYNALMIMSSLSKEFRLNKDAKLYSDRAETVKTKFIKLFWEKQNGYLYDYIDGDHKDMAFRPNQIFAISLPYQLVTGEKAKIILKAVAEKLYTPFGLRSLAPDDSNYRPHYGGDTLSRDSAYHQGTVWSWLLGPYITALVRIEGKTGIKKGRKIIEKMLPHLNDAGMGSISEILDGISPHTPRGAIAQAWSVAELLRSYVEDVFGFQPGKSVSKKTNSVKK